MAQRCVIWQELGQFGGYYSGYWRGHSPESPVKFLFYRQFCTTYRQLPKAQSCKELDAVTGDQFQDMAEIF